MKQKEFNQIEYISEYNKTHYKEFKARLKKEEFDEIEQQRQKSKMSKPQFLKEIADFYKKNKKI